MESVTTGKSMVWISGFKQTPNEPKIEDGFNLWEHPDSKRTARMKPHRLVCLLRACGRMKIYGELSSSFETNNDVRQQFTTSPYLLKFFVEELVQDALGVLLNAENIYTTVNSKKA